MAEPADPHSATISALDFAGLPTRSSVEDMPALVGERYELLGMLGAGAMGTVYRARDRELDEIVALKVLKQELASPEMLERFRREVKLARRVTHKNVARTFDIGEHGGDRFLTMEFVEGEMLGSLLARKGKLALDHVVRIALDVCAGLEAAHGASVLHRDLKPENVIIAKDGRAVITDFGIARVVVEGEALRTSGGLVGTPAYMAPEQVEGATDLDARADLYALGTMLFELLTGRLAWPGDSIVSVAAGRLLRPPPDIRSVDASVPAGVAEVVLRLMARKKEDRFASAAEAARAIGALELGGVPSASRVPRPPSSSTILTPATAAARARATPGARSVAVLPVLNLGGAEDAYLVDSVNEDVVDLLSMVPGLLVRPRGETSRWTDTVRDIREIGRTLGVDVVVDASFRRLGETVRASFRLIAVEDGFQLWAKRFDRAPSAVLSIADDAAQAIAQALTAELTAPDRAPAKTVDPETEDLYLRGRHLLRRAWSASAKDAAGLLGRASERAPDDPRILGAWALALARCYGMEFQGRDVEVQARTVGTRALERDPKQPEAKCAFATLHFAGGETETAVRWFREVLQVAPNCVDAFDWLGRIMTEVGMVDEGLAMLERAIAIDPECSGAKHQIARVHGVLEGRAALMKHLGEMPTQLTDLPTWLLFQVRDAMWRRDVDTARELEELVAKLPLPDVARFPIAALLRVILGKAGDLLTPAIVDRNLPIDASRPPRRAAFNAQMRAELFMSLGEPAPALEALRVADANGLFDVVFLARCPLFEPLRGDAEFLGVQTRVRERAKRIIAALV